MKQPIDSIEWIDTDLLEANDYNPNVVIGPEWRLLKLSLLKQGWIQPVLVVRTEDGRYRIVDGFHRSTMCKTDKDVAAMTGGKVPCAVLDIDEAERKMLTVRINRAKGTHQAVKMGDLVKALVKDHGIPVEEVCAGIGASKAEIELLLMEDVFEKKGTADHVYSRAWQPRDKG